MPQESVAAVGGVAVAAPDRLARQGAALPARLGYVDGLRALAALYVVAYHITLEFWPFSVPRGTTGLVIWPLSYGHYAVSAFIVLSGFSLMLPVARKGYRLPWGVWGFYWRRARRILPPYYFAIGFSLLLIWLFIGQKTGTNWDQSVPVSGRNVIEHLALIQDFLPKGALAIDHPLWSVALECQIYLLFPALALLWRRYPPLFAVLVVVALTLAMYYALIPTWIGHLPGYGKYEFAPQYIGLFGMGMFAASVYTKPSPRWSRVSACYGWEALTLLCVAAIVLWSATLQLYELDFFVGAGTVGLLLAAARPARLNLIRAALEWRPLVWIGGISYSVYLIHAPLIQVIWQYALRPLGWGDLATCLALLLTGIPPVILVSWGYWYCCERPFLNSRAR